jgi:hypothetical protein
MCTVTIKLKEKTTRSLVKIVCAEVIKVAGGEIRRECGEKKGRR